MNFMPEIASEWAGKWEWLNWYPNFWMIFFTVLIFIGVFGFAIKYRRRSEADHPRPILGSSRLKYSGS